MADPRPIVMRSVFCPRCDNKYESPTRLGAMVLMRKHVKKAHPSYFQMLEE